MKERPKIDLGLTGFDELFMTEQERHLNQLPKIHDIPLELIDDFPDHPYKVRMDEDMMQLIESVKERGVIVPVALRANFAYLAASFAMSPDNLLAVSISRSFC